MRAWWVCPNQSPDRPPLRPGCEIDVADVRLVGQQVERPLARVHVHSRDPVSVDAPGPRVSHVVIVRVVGEEPGAGTG